MNHKAIQKLDYKDISKIASGQVIVDLKSVIKELVENSLDAKATNIEIHLKDNGCDMIEVSDNGVGITKDDYEGVVKKYYTSKINNINDLENMNTLGFRGEALSSICELCTKFRIITRTKDDIVGKEIQYNRSCNIENLKDHAHTIGTSIFIEGLFDPLPVRKKVFMKSIKNQISSMITYIQQYAICCVHCRICITNTLKSGKKIELMNINVCKCLEDRLISIYGKDFLKTYKGYDYKIEFNKNDNEIIYDKYEIEELKDIKFNRNRDTIENNIWFIEGYCSILGCGLLSNNTCSKQYIYLNGRPIDYRK